MAERIPINFEYKGKDYIGEFLPVQGVGYPTAFQLLINNFYIGHLRLDKGQWIFEGHAMREMGEVFGQHIMAWYE
jgi:hypothetical protein